MKFSAMYRPGRYIHKKNINGLPSCPYQGNTSEIENVEDDIESNDIRSSIELPNLCLTPLIEILASILVCPIDPREWLIWPNDLDVIERHQKWIRARFPTFSQGDLRRTEEDLSHITWISPSVDWASPRLLPWHLPPLAPYQRAVFVLTVRFTRLHSAITPSNLC